MLKVLFTCWHLSPPRFSVVSGIVSGAVDPAPWSLSKVVDPAPWSLPGVVDYVFYRSCEPVLVLPQSAPLCFPSVQLFTACLPVMVWVLLIHLVSVTWGLTALSLAAIFLMFSLMLLTFTCPQPATFALCTASLLDICLFWPVYYSRRVSGDCQVFSIQNIWLWPTC